MGVTKKKKRFSKTVSESDLTVHWQTCLDVFNRCCYINDFTQDIKPSNVILCNEVLGSIAHLGNFFSM